MVHYSSGLLHQWFIVSTIFQLLSHTDGAGTYYME